MNKSLLCHHSKYKYPINKNCESCIGIYPNVDEIKEHNK